MFDSERHISARISKQHYDYLLTFPSISEGIRAILDAAMSNDGLPIKKFDITDPDAKRLYKKLAKAGYEEVLG